jgi:glyoxylase-like metal-dependent hydrolase (beta-lactamase superfamily II)
MPAIQKIQVEPLQSNCYLVWDDDTMVGVVIDPGGEPDKLIEETAQRGFEVKYILNTHGHGDHMAANRELKERFGASVLIHREEAPLLQDPLLNMSAQYGLPVTAPPPDGFLEVGQDVEFGRLSLHVLDTRGHSPAGVSFYGHGVVFSGDALFMGSVGRCDLPGGDMGLLVANIRENLLSLPGDTIVYPGHGPNTTIATELRHNPYLV